MNKMTIKDMAPSERPYEKALQYGISSLSDAELLALIIRSGSKDMSAVTLAQGLLNGNGIYKGLTGLNYMSQEELMKFKGVGKVKAVQILAITEISKRMSMESFKPTSYHDNPGSIAEYFMEQTRYLTKEKVYVVMLNSANAIIKTELLSEGTVNRSLITPREVFVVALKYDCAGVILLHHHPSGDVSPSEADIIVTRQVKDMGDQIGIPLLDHIILGDKVYYSFKENGLLQSISFESGVFNEI